LNPLSNYMKVGRDPGYIELFFDLAYAVLLGRLAHLLFHSHHGHIVIEDLIGFVFIFSLQFMVWMLFTVYMNIYGNNRLWQTLFGFALMTCLFAIAFLMEDIYGNAQYIAVIMGLMSLLIALMYRKSRGAIPENDAYNTYKSRASVVLALISFSCLLMSPYVTMAVMLVAYTLEHLLDEIFLNRVGMAKPDGEHLVERIGIFIVLLTGESFITLVGTMSGLLTFDEIAPVLLMLLLIFGLYINYFTYNDHMAHADYSRYSQILFSNSLIMVAFTLLPSIVYHGIHQAISIHTYQWFIAVFVVLFYTGNGLAYLRVPNNKLWQLIVYAGVIPLAYIALMWQLHGYWPILISFLFFVLGMATLLLVQGRRQHSYS